MSVAEHLGLDAPSGNELIHRASRRCAGRCTSNPRLAVVTDPLEVRRRTLSADRADTDAVFLAPPARLAVTTGPPRLTRYRFGVALASGGRREPPRLDG